MGGERMQDEVEEMLLEDKVGDYNFLIPIRNCCSCH